MIRYTLSICLPLSLSLFLSLSLTQAEARVEACDLIEEGLVLLQNQNIFSSFFYSGTHSDFIFFKQRRVWRHVIQ